MLQNDFLTQRMANTLPLQTHGLMQDGVKPHTAKVVLDFLNTNFGNRVMSNRSPGCHNCGKFWPPLNPDLNPCEFFRGVS
jgi:hypothetical protein